MLTTYISRVGNDYIAVVKFDSDVTEKIKKIISYCVQNSLHVHVNPAFDVDHYEVKIEINEILEGPVKNLLDFLQEMIQTK